MFNFSQTLNTRKLKNIENNLESSKSFETLQTHINLYA